MHGHMNVKKKKWWIWKDKGGNNCDLHKGTLHLLHLYDKETEKWQDIVDIQHITHLSGMIYLPVQ
jgi:hypothetical protein